MSDLYCLLYVTAADAAEAERIGRTLVEERLVACVNMVDGMRSLYWWDGAVQEGRECILLLKTTVDNRSHAMQRIAELHSYECPCVVSLDITGGHPDFLSWIDAQTKQPG